MKQNFCPHCHTIYRYGDVRKVMLNKELKCYRCGKNFKVSKIKILFLFLIIALITAIFDVLELWLISNVTFLALVITNIVMICVGIFLSPFFVSFKKFPKTNQNKVKKSN